MKRVEMCHNFGSIKAPFMLLLLSVFCAGAQTNGLLAWWTFDEGTGNTAADSSGNGHTASLIGTPGPTWTTGMIGGGIVVTGMPNAYLDCGNLADNLPAFAVCGWIRTTFTAPPTQPQLIAIGKLGAGGWATGAGWAVMFEHDAIRGFVQDANDYYESEPSAVMNDGLWHHFVFNVITVNTNLQPWQQNLDTWLDAVQYHNPSGVGVVSSWGNGSNILIGTDGTTNVNFSGTFDDVRIYDHALTQAEIDAIYSWRGSPPVIGVQPASRAAVGGANAAFGVTATAPGPLYYLWYDTPNISPAQTNAFPAQTNGTLTLTNIQLSDFGSYWVVVTNLAGAATSTSATLSLATNPLISMAGISGSSFILEFTTEFGPTYVVQRSDALTLASWQDVSIYQGTGATFPYADTNPVASQRMRFYRIRVR